MWPSWYFVHPDTGGTFMPIYEFYCSGCNTIYNFYSKSIDTGTRPRCPRCHDRVLERRVSIFSTTRHKNSEGDTSTPDFDEQKMEQAMQMLAGEAGRMDEENPKQAADLLRKLSDMAGLKLKPGMEEALHRIERGEDPEQIENEMGDIFDEEDPFEIKEKGSKFRLPKPPRVDETLYEL
jgi:putative FmdB family regulatory protein